MKPYSIDFELYADSEAEVAELKRDIVDLIEDYRCLGIAVSATKLRKVIDLLKSNPILSTQAKKLFTT